MNKMAVLFIITAVCITGFAFFGSIDNLKAEESMNAELSSTLDMVISNQQAIMKKLDDMTEELHIIKIRATRR